MKSLLSRSPVVLAVAAACLGALAPAHATITVSTWANCTGAGTSKFNYSYTYQSPALAEWSFGVVQQEVTNFGSFISGNSAVGSGYVWRRYDFEPPTVTYQATGIHTGYDGFANYTVYTTATTCDPSPYSTYQEPPRAAARGTAAVDVDTSTTQTAPAEVAGTAVVAAAPGVRLDEAASGMTMSQYARAQRNWEVIAPRAAAESVSALTSDIKHPWFERALKERREKLTFVAAQTNSTELGKLTPAKSLPSGNASEAGWSGYARIFQTRSDE